ncbi:hypothetical protein B0H13DRAFT_2651760 [Mycena leptocephala]|nr:hypothetical protein B0H13DRAFT_2651760 [Mycena leptocephala]
MDGELWRRGATWREWSADHDAIFSSNYFLACQAWATAGTMVECLEASYEEALSAQRSSFALTITMIGRFLYDFLALFTTVVTWVFVLTDITNEPDDATSLTC